jgi:outer membrane protein insertion porin family
VGDSFLSTVRVALMHDTRDAAFLPSEGHYVEASVEQAFAEFDYTRFEVDGRQYFTTYRRPDGYGKHILTLAGQIGWTGDSTPIYERFYAGGFQSFRGFAFRGVTPIENGVEVGGQFQALGTVEYMLPVTANEMLKVVAFTDFGTVDNDVSLDNFRVTVGGGVRVQVPGMGPVPIALDWGVPLVKEGFDRTQVFSFYIGINR